MAHITGGGLENIPRVLPEGLAAHLKATWLTPPIFTLLQEMRGHEGGDVQGVQYGHRHGPGLRRLGKHGGPRRDTGGKAHRQGGGAQNMASLIPLVKGMARHLAAPAEDSSKIYPGAKESLPEGLELVGPPGSRQPLTKWWLTPPIFTLLQEMGRGSIHEGGDVQGVQYGHHPAWSWSAASRKARGSYDAIPEARLIGRPASERRDTGEGRVVIHGTRRCSAGVGRLSRIAQDLCKRQKAA